MNLKLYDGTSVAGSVVAVDKSVDTAVIRADDGTVATLRPLALGTLAGVHVGDTTIAVGSPFGLSQTVTTGIVSALGRTVPTQVGELRDLIQTDAAINSGNSGGPLADREGKAIGINTAIASASGGSDGIGFAVPIDDALKILDKVKAGTWTAEDNAPFDGTDSLGGLFDQFLGPNGLDGLRDLFGLGPNGSQAPATRWPPGCLRWASSAATAWASGRPIAKSGWGCSSVPRASARSWSTSTPPTANRNWNMR